jgi:hypothetical protein
MDRYEQALAKLIADERGPTELEQLTGLPAETLRDLKNKTTTNPRFNTLKALAAFYEKAA